MDGLEDDAGLPRLVPLQGCSNLRDLGGYRAADDYLATNQIWRREHALPPKTPDAVRDALLTALRPLLEDGLGLHPARLRALRGAMLEWAIAG